MSAHRYWRIWIPTHVDNASIQNWAEFGFYDSAPTSLDDDLCTGGTAIGADLLGGTLASNLFDDDPSTWSYWYEGTGWVGYDFGSGNDKDITYVHLQQRNPTYSQYAGYFEVQYSDDGSSWTTSWTVTAATPWDAGETRCYKNDGTLYAPAPTVTDPQKNWRVRATSTQDGSYMSPCEIVFLDSSEDPISYTGGTPAASSGSDTDIAEIFDGVTSGAYNYCPCSLSSGGWAAFAFASEVSVRGFTYYARDDATYCIQSPTAFIVECRTDFSEWTAVWDDTTTSDWTQNESRTFLYSDVVTATPVMSPTSGGYDAGTTVTITCSTSGSTIYYTTDGTDPDSGDSVYSTPIEISDGMTIKAFAVASGYDDSGVASESYTIEEEEEETETQQPIIFIVT